MFEREVRRPVGLSDAGGQNRLSQKSVTMHRSDVFEQWERPLLAYFARMSSTGLHVVLRDEDDKPG